MACVVGAFSLADFLAGTVSLAFLPAAGFAAAAVALVARPFAAGLAACRAGCLAAGFLAAARASALFDLAGCLLGFLKSSSESSVATSELSPASDEPSSLPSSSASSRVVRHDTQYPFRMMHVVAVYGSNAVKRAAEKHAMLLSMGVGWQPPAHEAFEQSTCEARSSVQACEALSLSIQRRLSALDGQQVCQQR